MLAPYRPEPYVNFAEPEPRQKMLDALASVRGQLGRTYPLRIGEKKIEPAGAGNGAFASIMPAAPQTVVGHVTKAGVEHAQEAIRVAAETFKTWRWVEPET